jgi:putative nucleotidyltransferase with HDIG domain/PAS domain S-box-containing protein
LRQRCEDALGPMVALLDALHCGVLLLARDGAVRFANDRAAELFGIALERLVGTNIRRLYASIPDWGMTQRVLLALGSGIEQEFFVPHRDGRRIPVIVTGRWVPLLPEPEPQLVVTLNDISRQQQAEHEAREQLSQVARLGDVVIQQALSLEDQSHVLEERVRQRTRELDEANMDAIYMLAVASEAKDYDTGAHVRRIQHYARALAQRIGLPERDAERIGYSAILHDVGKMQVPDEVLKKPGVLTSTERDQIELHTTVGERILSKRPFFDEARKIARSHHENWDGSGYPDGLAGADIPLSARIVRLVDVFDGLISQRSYKAAWPAADAANYVRANSGKLFDPRLVAGFESLFEDGQMQRIATEFATQPRP